MIKYGLISETDGKTLEKTLDLIMNETIFSVHGGGEPYKYINTCEVGIFDGQTSRGIRDYLISKGFNVNHTAIDNNKDKEVLKPFPECNLIIGNSNEVYNQLEDESQHLIFEDSCHCFSCVVSSFFCYAPKVKVGGYFCFHDTGKHIAKFKDFQHGDKNNPLAYISVREALTAIGLIDGLVVGERGEHFNSCFNGDWELVFDEADPTDQAGGITVFKRLF